MVSYLDQDPTFKGSSTIGDYVLAELMDNEDKQRAFQLMADLRLSPEQGLANHRESDLLDLQHTVLSPHLAD